MVKGNIIKSPAEQTFATPRFVQQHTYIKSWIYEYQILLVKNTKTNSFFHQLLLKLEYFTGNVDKCTWSIKHSTLYMNFFWNFVNVMRLWFQNASTKLTIKHNILSVSSTIMDTNKYLLKLYNAIYMMQKRF